MAKQQFTFTLSDAQVKQAIAAYAAGMVDTKAYDLEVTGLAGVFTVKATKRRAARKANAPKVAAVSKAAA